MKRIALCSFVLLFTSHAAFALLPPKYLSVPHFKSCLSQKNMGTWTAYCLPQKKPRACPLNAWHQVLRDNSLNQCR